MRPHAWRACCPRYAAARLLSSAAPAAPPVASVPRSSPPTAAANHDLITRYSQSPTRTVTFADLMRYGNPPLDEQTLLQSAERTRSELMAGLARRVRIHLPAPKQCIRLINPPCRSRNTCHCRSYPQPTRRSQRCTACTRPRSPSCPKSLKSPRSPTTTSCALPSHKWLRNTGTTFPCSQKVRESESVPPGLSFAVGHEKNLTARAQASKSAGNTFPTRPLPISWTELSGIASRCD